MELTAAEPASWRDYLELCKPKVVLLMIMTAVIGMFLATPGFVPWDVLVFGNLGIALVDSNQRWQARSSRSGR